MKQKIRLHDVVALLNPVKEKGLRKGQLGTVVEILDRDVFEVEFCDRQGRTLVMMPILGQELLLLKYELDAA